MKIAVLGDGGWGTSLAVLLANKGFKVYLWGVFKENIYAINRDKVNVKFLPGIKIPKHVAATTDLDEALHDADVIVLAIPSRFLRHVLTCNKNSFRKSNAIYVSVVKGLEEATLKRMSEVIIEILGNIKLCVLSGPSIAPEVARGIPTTVTVASSNLKLAKKVRDIFRTDRFRVYTNSDVIGIELGGSLKNIIAIAVGISDGLKFGANTKAALLTRGLKEISRLGIVMGGKIETFMGLSGLGDLVTTSISSEGRNRGFGEKIGKGRDPKKLLKESVMEIEGAWTAKAALLLSRRYGVELPITKEVYSVIFENKSPKLAVKELMLREPKEE